MGNSILTLQSPHGNIIVRQITLDETKILHDIFKQRVECRNEFGVITWEKFPDGWNDEMDFYSEHYVAICNDILIASGRQTFFNNITEHPYYPAIEHCLNFNLKKVPISYLSRDQVLKQYRGLNLRKMLLNLREQDCKKKNISNLFIDVAKTGRQFSNFSNDGYNELGEFKTDKIYGSGTV